MTNYTAGDFNTIPEMLRYVNTMSSDIYSMIILFAIFMITYTQSDEKYRLTLTGMLTVFTAMTLYALQMMSANIVVMCFMVTAIILLIER